LTGLELAYAIGALVAIVAVVFGIRRAARKQLRARPPTPALPRRAGEGADVPARARTPKPEPEPEPEDEPAPEPAGAPAPDRKSLEKGLAKTRSGFVARLGKLFSRKQIDDDILDELEEVLLTADIGPRTADKLFQSIKAKLSRAELADADAIWDEVRKRSADILAVGAEPVDFDARRPFVLLTIGVNGVGKTTTIGKLASIHTARGKKVLLAAGDTFRAAASEQLEIWGQRAGAPVVRGKSNADPSSVIFEAIQKGVAEDYDMVIADTAGRLHTKVDLMEELMKVRRVCNKALEGAPHETWLVVDATTGQNAIAQAAMFKQAMDITGIVLTKLDGTAKGGVILGICDELGVPVRYIGIGEQLADLQPFDPQAFIDALYAPEETADAA
jgi:fused signal recognition particle receptor